MLEYKTIEDLLFVGFTVTKVDIDDTTVVLKSLNQKEINNILLMCPHKDKPRFNRAFENLLISHSIFLIDGLNTLVDRPSSINAMMDWADFLDTPYRKVLLSEILLMQKTVEHCLSKLEAYSYETTSRYMWPTYRDKILSDSSLTGVQGTEKLGINTFQLSWVFLNTHEDQRLQEESSWTFSKFIASATAPKQVAKIDNRDKFRLKRLYEDREYIRTGKLPETEVITIAARTDEELTQQLKMAVSGYKDLHDQFIENLELTAQRKREERKTIQEAVILEAQKKREAERSALTDEEIAERSYMTILSPDQLNDKLRRRR